MLELIERLELEYSELEAEIIEGFRDTAMSAGKAVKRGAKHAASTKRGRAAAAVGRFVGRRVAKKVKKLDRRPKFVRKAQGRAVAGVKRGVENAAEKLKRAASDRKRRRG